jgi:hypothetical protein
MLLSRPVSGRSLIGLRPRFFMVLTSPSWVWRVRSARSFCAQQPPVNHLVPFCARAALVLHPFETSFIAPHESHRSAAIDRRRLRWINHALGGQLRAELRPGPRWLGGAADGQRLLARPGSLACASLDKPNWKKTAVTARRSRPKATLVSAQECLRIFVGMPPLASFERRFSHACTGQGGAQGSAEVSSMFVGQRWFSATAC